MTEYTFSEATELFLGGVAIGVVVALAVSALFA